MSTYIYCRTSTNEQNVNQQAEYLANKHHHDYIVTEQFTGTTTDRPKFNKLINQLTNGDRLIVREVSRIGRNTSEVLEVAKQLKAKGVSLLIDNLGVDIDTPAGQMVFTVLAAAAKMERDLLLERQAIGIARAKAEGKFKGRNAIDPKVISTAKSLIATGMSKASVAKQLKIGESTLYKYLSSNQ
jgi:DNA invertase Pin-like site-specific DNA recombinase